MIFLLRRGKVRQINRHDLLINRNTPRGEPAALYERKPFGGRRLLEDGEFLGEVINGLFVVEDCNMTRERASLIESLGFPVDEGRLFHNGHVYTTWRRPFKTLDEALAENRAGKKKISKTRVDKVSRSR